MELTLFHKCVFEFLGTMVLVLMGDGVCAAVTLNKSKAQGAGWVVISLAWGLAVMCGVFIAGPYSGAHLNPAVSVGLALAGKFAWSAVLPYVVAQISRASCSTQPGRGKCWVNSFCATLSTLPAWSKTLVQGKDTFFHIMQVHKSGLHWCTQSPLR